MSEANNVSEERIALLEVSVYSEPHDYNFCCILAERFHTLLKDDAERLIVWHTHGLVQLRFRDASRPEPETGRRKQKPASPSVAQILTISFPDLEACAGLHTPREAEIHLGECISLSFAEIVPGNHLQNHRGFSTKGDLARLLLAALLNILTVFIYHEQPARLEAQTARTSLPLLEELAAEETAFVALALPALLLTGDISPDLRFSDKQEHMRMKLHLIFSREQQGHPDVWSLYRSTTQEQVPFAAPVRWHLDEYEGVLLHRVTQEILTLLKDQTAQRYFVMARAQACTPERAYRSKREKNISSELSCNQPTPLDN